MIKLLKGACGMLSYELAQSTKLDYVGFWFITRSVLVAASAMHFMSGSIAITFGRLV